ncbi:Homeodomain-like protein, partial [Neoconidiobolus thromboides FSU 785]
KGAWTKEEDGLLIQLMNENKNTISWSSFGRVIKTRTGKQCRERWHNHLDPNVNKAPFTDQENQIILDMYHKIGPKWATISKQLVGRPDNSIKNHFNTALNPHKQEARRK